MNKEVKVQRFQVWRDPQTKKIIDRRPVSTHLISQTDIERMNKQNFGNSIGRTVEYYFEAIEEPKPKPKEQKPKAK